MKTQRLPSIKETVAPELLSDWELVSATIEKPDSFGICYPEPYNDGLPLEDGRCTCRLVEKTGAVIDVRWGEYGVPGSILATFRVAISE